jgi:hypothetical protein
MIGLPADSAIDEGACPHLMRMLFYSDNATKKP